MQTIQIRKISITDLDTDAIVNAANEGLWAGGGVCGAIFQAAGHDKLQAACSKIGHCDTGSAVITPGFDLKAKYIIHAVGPRWMDGRHKEPERLRSAYYKSLELAVKYSCTSIGFPLISAGIFGYPMEAAWEEAFSACSDFLRKNPKVTMNIVFAVLDPRILKVGREVLAGSTALKLKISGREVDAIYFHKPEEPHGYLSNWYPAAFDLDGIHYSSTEQYTMYQKCMLFGDEVSAAAVMATDDPAKQQKIGQGASGYVHLVWTGARQMIAFRGLLAKFEQNEELKQELLKTGDAFLVECAGSDKNWACGIRLNDDKRFDSSNWSGQNILGFALMEVRKMLREN